MGRRAVDQRTARTVGPLPLVAVGIVAAVVAGLHSFRAGGLVLSLVLVGCALARGFLPVAGLGPLAVRSRAVDVVTCAVLAAGLALLSLIAPGGAGPVG